jgi:hypothetical protein
MPATVPTKMAQSSPKTVRNQNLSPLKILSRAISFSYFFSVVVLSFVKNFHFATILISHALGQYYNRRYGSYGPYEELFHGYNMNGGTVKPRVEHHIGQ